MADEDFVFPENFGEKQELKDNEFEMTNGAIRTSVGPIGLMDSKGNEKSVFVDLCAAFVNPSANFPDTSFSTSIRDDFMYRVRTGGGGEPFEINGAALLEGIDRSQAAYRVAHGQEPKEPRDNNYLNFSNKQLHNISVPYRDSDGNKGLLTVPYKDVKIDAIGSSHKRSVVSIDPKAVCTIYVSHNEPEKISGLEAASDMRAEQEAYQLTREASEHEQPTPTSKEAVKKTQTPAKSKVSFKDAKQKFSDTKQTSSQPQAQAKTATKNTACK